MSFSEPPYLKMIRRHDGIPTFYTTGRPCPTDQHAAVPGGDRQGVAWHRLRGHPGPDGPLGMTPPTPFPEDPNSISFNSTESQIRSGGDWLDQQEIAAHVEVGGLEIPVQTARRYK